MKAPTRMCLLFRAGLLPGLVIALLGGPPAFAQCDPTVPTFVVDLSYSPVATYLSPPVQRLDNCCGTTAPDQCLQFILTLHPLAQGIIFNICSGAIPGGAMYYQLACGPQSAVGAPLCLNGAGPHIITFCKPGNNVNEYCITSLGAPEAGPDIAVNDGCAGTLTSTGYDPTTVLWTSVAPGAQGAYDGYLACATCSTTTVTPSGAFPPFVDYMICGVAIGACGNTPTCDTTRVYFNSTLTATIAPLQPTVCYGSAGTTITAAGGGGTPPYSYLWNTGDTTASIFIGAGSYTVQVSDTSNCPPTLATVVVTEFLQPIQAFAGADIVVCGNAFPAQLNGTVTGVTTGQWITGNGQFAPTDSALNATYMPTAAEIAAGSVQLVLATTNNGMCPGDTDTVLVTFADPFISLSITSTDVACAGGSDGTATVLPNSSSFAYLWNDPAAQTTNAAIGLGAGNYTVLITDVSGCDTTLATTVAAPAAITIANLQVTDETCAGFGNGSVSVTASGGTAPYQYYWNTGDTTAIITVGAGTYTVSVTDANGCLPATGSATVVATSQPNTAMAGPDQVNCLGALPVDLDGTVLNATSGQWSGGNGTYFGTGTSVDYMPTNAEILAGGLDLYLTTTGVSGCPQDVDTVHVTLSNAFIAASITATGVSCTDGTNGTATFLPNAPGLTYLWNDPAAQTTSTATGLLSGTWTITVTDALGCDTSLSVFVPVPPPLYAFQMITTDPSCANSADGSAMVTAAGGTPGYTYQWSANTGGQVGTTAVGLVTGTYIVVITDANGCTAQATASITAPPPVVLLVQIPDTLCVDASTVLTAQASGGDGSYTITWAGIGIGSPLTYSFPASQTVVVSAIDGNGCASPVIMEQVTVLDLSLANLDVYGDTIACPGESATVSATLNNYPGIYTIAWPQLGTTGNGPFTVPVTSNQTLDVIVTDQCGNTLSGSVQLILDVPPTITLPPLLAEGCAPLTVQMPDSLTTQAVDYLWQFGDGSSSTDIAPVHTYTTGTYNVSLTVTTALGCSATAVNTGLVNAFPSPTAAFSASTYSTDYLNQPIVFTDQSPGSPIAFHWDLGDGNTSNGQDVEHTFLNIGVYSVTLTVTDPNGCTGSVSQSVEITPVYDIVIPNIFTPDPDGGNGGGYDPNDLSNNVFYPFVRFIKDFNMRIYNRWGELVFESNDLLTGWDGYYRGQLSQQDVYAYTMLFRFVDDHLVERMGDITLMR